jgi:hypothetical protein
MNDSCIITYADGKWYPKGQARLLKSLANVGYKGHVFLFDGTSVGEECPSHADVPYGFKYWIFDLMRFKGYEAALWVDCSFYAIKPIDHIFSDIERNGYVLQRSIGYTVGDWTSDKALNILGMSRPEARQIVMHDGGFLGLKFADHQAHLFLEAMLGAMKRDGLFQGSWTNENHEVSQDDGVGGHRHDMSVGSIFAHFHQMEYADAGTYWCYTNDHGSNPDVCFLAEGM